MPWLYELKTAVALYSEGDFQGCIAHINTVFRDTTPNYPRTRYYALLACCTDDWREAEASLSIEKSDTVFFFLIAIQVLTGKETKQRMRTAAESTYAHWCIHNHADDYAGADRLREKLRAILDEVDEKLKSRRPSDWYEHQITWTEADVDERDEERDAELAEAMAEHDADTAGQEMEDDDSVTEGEVEDDSDLAEEEIEGDANIAKQDIENDVDMPEGKLGNATEAAGAETENDVDVAEGWLEKDADFAEEELEDGAADHEAEVERLAELAEAEIERLAELAEAGDEEDIGEAEMERLAELAEAEEEEEADQY